MMKNKYYLPFLPAADVDYLFLLSLWDIAEYNEEKQTFDTVRYNSLKELAERLSMTAPTLSRKLSDTRYNAFFAVDKQSKSITLKNDTKEIAPFVMLTARQVWLMREVGNNFFCRYLIYTVYYCRYSESKGLIQDFTAKQFLSACGYCITSNKHLQNVSKCNKLLLDNKIISITKVRDNTGRTRNRYILL